MFALENKLGGDIVYKITSFGSDGASVMTGKNGVQGIMKMTLPQLLAFHCFAHKNQLAIKDALADMKTDSKFDFDVVDELLTEAYAVFRYEVLCYACSVLLI